MTSWIRQLCCLGLPSPMVLDELLLALRPLIPTDTTCFCWVDDDGRLTGGGRLTGEFVENPDGHEALRHYVRTYCDRVEREVMGGFAETLQRPHEVLGLDDMLQVSRRAYFRHGLYNEVLLPLRIHDFLRVAVRGGNGARGSLVLGRGPGEPPFTERERRQLGELAPFIGHALNVEPNRGRNVSAAGNGLLLFDRHGRLQHLCPEAHRLVPMLHCQNPHERPPGDIAEPPAIIRRIVQDLRAIAESHVPHRPPEVTCNTAWGQFRIRAHWLDATNLEHSLIGVNIERRVPITLELMRQVRTRNLSQRQLEVACLLAGGSSYQDIGTRLGIGRESVVTHARNLYAKLGVNGRIDLLDDLLGVPAPGSRHFDPPSTMLH